MTQNRPTLKSRDIFLNRIDISIDDILATLKQPRLVLFLVLITASLVALDTGQLMVQGKFSFVAVFWIATICLQVGFFSFFSILYAYLQQRYNTPILYMPLVNTIAFSVNFPIFILASDFLNGMPLWSGYSLRLMISAFVICLIFEAIYFTYVFPILMRNIYAKLEDTPIEVREIFIAGQRFDISQIQTLRGQEHYVLVTTASGEFRLRARLGDLVSQTKEEDGILAHRSYWIARQCISKLISENGSMFIITLSGERLSVARPRHDHVRDWVEQYATDAG